MRSLYVLLLAGLLVVIGHAPLSTAGFYAPEDHLQIAAVSRDGGTLLSRGSLWGFFSGDQAETRGHIEAGRVPWWTPLDVKWSFFRPLSSALLRIDWALFGWSPLGYHAVSLLWFLALVACVAALFARVLPRAEAAVATLLFAASSPAWEVVAFVCSRHLLIGGVPAVLGLVLWIDWRKDNKLRTLLSAAAAFAVAALATEATISVLAYVCAYEWFETEGSRAQRVRAIVVIALVVAAYVALHRMFGHGARGIPEYVSPTEVPRLLGRWLRLSTFVIVGAAAAPLPRIVGVLATVVVVAAMVVGLRRGTARPWWLLVGCLAGMLPLALPLPSPRLVLVPAIGASALVACALTGAWTAVRSRERGALDRALSGACFGLLAFVGFPFQMLCLFVANRTFADESAAIASVAQSTLSDARLAQCERVVALTVPRDLDPTFVAAHPAGGGRWRILSAMPSAHEVQRIDEDSIRLRVVGVERPLSASPTFPFSSYALRTGDEVRLDVGRVRVASLSGPMPESIEVDFDVPLDRLCFAAWKDGAMSPVALPAVGATLTLDGPTEQER